jgi:hypothetical protein
VDDGDPPTVEPVERLSQLGFSLALWVEDLAKQSCFVMQIGDPLLDGGLVLQLPEPVLLGLINGLLGGSVVSTKSSQTSCSSCLSVSSSCRGSHCRS